MSLNQPVLDSFESMLQNAMQAQDAMREVMFSEDDMKRVPYCELLRTLYTVDINLGRGMGHTTFAAVKSTQGWTVINQKDWHFANASKEVPGSRFITMDEFVAGASVEQQVIIDFPATVFEKHSEDDLFQALSERGVKRVLLLGWR